MSKTSASKAQNTKFYKVPGSVFSRAFSFDSEKKQNQRNKNQSHGNGDQRKVAFSSPYLASTAGKYSMKYKNEVQELESRSVQELEKYAVSKAEETTQKINGCVKVAEEMREVSSRTLGNLHQQGEQITKTHGAAASIDYQLSRGEKLLGSLGGLFSRTWKPKRNREIKGPLFSRDDSFMKRANNVEHGQKLGLYSRRSQSNRVQFSFKPSSAIERVEMEKMKQDDALTDLSNLLAELKAMAVDIGSEIERQNKALDHMHDDVEELNTRVRGANLRTRRLLGR